MKTCPKCGEPVAMRGMTVEFIRTYQESQEVLCQHHAHSAAQALVEAATRWNLAIDGRDYDTLTAALAALDAAMEKPA